MGVGAGTAAGATGASGDARSAGGRRRRPRLAPADRASAVGAGLAAGVVTVAYSISLAALVFRGPLVDHLADGVGMALVGTVVVGIGLAVRSSLAGSVPSAGGKALAVLAVAAASLADTVTPEALFPTVLALLLAATAASAVVCLLLGWFRGGALVRFVPYPVIGGFLAAAGALGATGGWDLLSGGRGVGRLLEADAWPVWVPGVAMAVAGFVIMRRESHHLALPGLFLATPIVLHVAYALAGVSLDEAAARGWLLASGVEGSVVRVDRLSVLGDADWGAVGANVGALATVVVLVVASILLYAQALEISTDRDVDVNRELRVHGWSSLVALAAGGAPSYTNFDATSFASTTARGKRIAALVATALAVLALAGGSRIVDLVPTAMVGGLLGAAGLATFVDWVWGSRHRLARFESLIVLLVAAAVFLLGFVAGTTLGLVVAVVLFVLRYSRISVVRHELTGAAISSSVDRTTAERAVLDARGEEIVLLDPRGYLFFGSANSLVEAVHRNATDGIPITVLILDLNGVSGIDSSGIVSFEKIGRMAVRWSMHLVLCGGEPAVERAVLRALQERHDLAVTIAPDADHALELAEDLLLAEAALDDAEAVEVPLAASLHLALGDPDLAARFSSRFERRELAPGDVVVVQGTRPDGLSILERGRLTAELHRTNLPPVRLRTMRPGAVVGEIGLYLHADASAAVVADVPSVLWHLPADVFDGLAESDPEAAAALHLHVAQTLARRLATAQRTVRVLRD